jgi:hypothetical protein
MLMMLLMVARMLLMLMILMPLVPVSAPEPVSTGTCRASASGGGGASSASANSSGVPCAMPTTRAEDLTDASASHRIFIVTASVTVWGVRRSARRPEKACRGACWYLMLRPRLISRRVGAGAPAGTGSGGCWW